MLINNNNNSNNNTNNTDNIDKKKNARYGHKTVRWSTESIMRGVWGGVRMHAATVAKRCVHV